MQHPDFAVLTVSWELALRAAGYADNTVKAYQKAVRSLAEWLAEHLREDLEFVWAAEIGEVLDAALEPGRGDARGNGAGFSRCVA